jgi:UPF0716 protein FxsA
MLAVLLLVLWPVAEIYVLIKVAEAIGVLLTALLLIASWPAGSWALRSQGRAAWTRLRAELAAGRPPGRAVLDGALILVGGVLLIIPGFIGDGVGILLLLGPTRSLIRHLTVRRLQSRLIHRATRRWGGGRPGGPGRGYDVDSTATDVDRATLPR